MASEFKSRTCKGICKNFKIKKPIGEGRYEAGQARCQICQTWVTYQGCHLKNGEPATDDSLGWFCNCCNYRVRTKPRNKIYKQKLLEKKPQKTNHFENTKSIMGENNRQSKGNLWNILKNKIFPSVTSVSDKSDIRHKITKSIPSNSPSRNVAGSIEGIVIKQEVAKLIQNLKEEKNQSLEKKEDLVNLYFHLGSIKKMRDETNQPEETIRRHTQTSKRLPPKLRDAHNRGMLSLDPKISLNIALHATDFFRWDGEDENQDLAYDLAMSISKFMKKPEFKKN